MLNEHTCNNKSDCMHIPNASCKFNTRMRSQLCMCDIKYGKIRGNKCSKC